MVVVVVVVVVWRSYRESAVTSAMVAWTGMFSMAVARRAAAFSSMIIELVAAGRRWLLFIVVVDVVQFWNAVGLNSLQDDVSVVHSSRFAFSIYPEHVVHRNTERSHFLLEGFEEFMLVLVGDDDSRHASHADSEGDRIGFGCGFIGHDGEDGVSAQPTVRGLNSPSFQQTTDGGVSDRPVRDCTIACVVFESVYEQRATIAAEWPECRERDTL